MTSPEQHDSLDQLPEAVVDEERKGLPIVWLLPIVALLVGGWLIYKTYSEKGPEIVISFKTAEGIEEGKTLVKLKDVKVGHVETVEFSRDLSEVLLTVSMVKGARPYLTDKTRFWVVRPRVGAGQVSGLGTLLSGAYIAIDPDDTGKQVNRFTGLETPPVITGGRKGTSYRLKASSVGSLAVGSPVYFRQIAVGEVTEYHLSDDHEYVELGIFIESPHDKFVTDATRFWNASGLDVSLSASGVTLEMESIVSLISGGIAFDTPGEQAATARAEKDHMFHLFANRAQSREQPITETTTFALAFSGTVRGLEVGAPVEFRGIRIGTVKAIELGPGPRGTASLVPVVLVDFEPQRLQAYGTLKNSPRALENRDELVSDPVARVHKQVEEDGLRARLQTGNLVTGKLFVDIGFYPDAPPPVLIDNLGYPQIPTIPSSLQGILEGIQQILDKLEKADLQQMIGNLNQLMVSTSNLMAVLEKDAPQLSDDLHGTLLDARKMLSEASATLKTVNNAASPRGEIGNQLQDTLKEITAAARSIRVMTEYLERHPDALLKGKGIK
ncbi:MAG: MlaD family protein [Thiogranum sp.]